VDEEAGSDASRIADEEGSFFFDGGRPKVDDSGARGEPTGDKSIGVAFGLDSSVAGRVASSSFVVCIVGRSVLVDKAGSAVDADDTSFIRFPLTLPCSNSKSTSSSYSLMVG
jgi:hypothetical protein